MIPRYWTKILLCAAIIGLAEAPALGSALSLESTTIPRLYDQDPKTDSALYLPLYEYLSLGLTDLGVQGLSIHGSAWGRLGMGQLRGEDRGAAQLMNGYLEWRSADNTINLLLGRQLLFKGVVTENMDGLLASLRLPKDFGVEVFGGKPVVSKEDSLKGDYLGGARIYHRWVWKGEIGISYLHSMEGDRVDRQNLGMDGFYRPLSWWDLAGHVYYSFPFSRLYELTVLTTVKPIRRLRVSLDFNERDPAARLGARSIFSVFAESQWDTGITAEYDIGRHVMLSADGRHYGYQKEDMDGIARASVSGARVGGEVRAFDITRGKEEYRLGLHRLTTPDQGYMEVRFYTLQNIIPNLSGAFELIDTLYDDFIHDVNYSLNMDGSLIYSIRKNLTIGGTLLYSRNPRSLYEYEGLIKLTYILREVFGR